MKQLLITDDKTADGKSRQFRAAMLGYIKADMLWEGGSADTKATRPIYLTLAGTEASLKPFLANIRKGRKAHILDGFGRGDGQMELLRSGNYEYTWTRGKGTSLVTAYQPELFQADPGLIDNQWMGFISTPPVWWVTEQSAKLSAPDVIRVQSHLRCINLTLTKDQRPVNTDADYLRGLIAAAAHFCLFLDKRTRRPIINDMAFAAQLYLAAIRHGIAVLSEKPGYRSRPFEAYGLRRLGLHTPVVVHTLQDVMDVFLAQQIEIWRNV